MYMVERGKEMRHQMCESTAVLPGRRELITQIVQIANNADSE